MKLLLLLLLPGIQAATSLVTVVTNGGSLQVLALRLPQVFLKPRKMQSSSAAVHWRRPAELG